MIQEKRSAEQISTLEIYTDGSCKSLAKIRFGGWGFIALRGGEFQYRACGGEQDTTNQRMELLAIRNALDGWVNSKGEDVANQDLWVQIIPYFENFWYNFSKVKGHADNYWNNECDRIAQEVAQDLKDSFRGLDNER